MNRIEALTIIRSYVAEGMPAFDSAFDYLRDQEATNLPKNKPETDECICENNGDYCPSCSVWKRLHSVFRQSHCTECHPVHNTICVCNCHSARQE